jgi:hypothetical protein
MAFFKQLLMTLCRSSILDNYETIWLVGPSGEKLQVPAKIDTGANRTSVDRSIAEKIGLLATSNIVEYREFFSGLGREQRPMVHCRLIIKGLSQPTTVSISDRSHMKHQVIVGRHDIQAFLVKPAYQEETH